MKAFVDVPHNGLFLLKVTAAEYDQGNGVLRLYSDEFSPCQIKMSYAKANEILETLFSDGKVDLRAERASFESWKTMT